MKSIFNHRTLENGINLYTCATNKFKTTTVCLFMHKNLRKETATKTALLPFVLKRGTRNFPTSRNISLYLENLYGADMGGDILKRGEIQIQQFFLQTVNPEFINDKMILDKGLQVFKELVTDPLLENGSFKKSYVEQEKDLLRRTIQSLYSDKFNYTIERCFHEMCKDEPYSIYKYGSIEDLDSINSENLYEYYRDCLQKCPIDIFVLGGINESEITEKLQELFGFERNEEKTVKTSDRVKDIKEKFVEERQQVSQGKLSMGFRTNTRYGDEDYFALMVYNGILGGGPHSKLFQNVREKASLAYYAFSKLEKTKGLMLITSGIEFENKDKAIDIIKKQLEDIKQGKISDYEFDSTIKSLINSLKEAADSPSMIISIYLDGLINGVEISLEDMIEEIKKVTKKDVMNVARKIQLDTIFFLNKAE